MFTGIVAGLCPVVAFDYSQCKVRLGVALDSLADGLEEGASVAVNGVCLTVVGVAGDVVMFDVVPATTQITNLSSLGIGKCVNVERSMRFGDEIGGHLLSGHVCTTVTVMKASSGSIGPGIVFQVPQNWSRYLMPKGFVALNGVSLTLSEFDRESSVGRVNLIPETLRRTNLGEANSGDQLNLEIDTQTMAIVNTVENYLSSNPSIVESSSS